MKEFVGVDWSTVEGRAGAHRVLCEQLTDVYERKNRDYGDTFHESFVEEGMAMVRIRIGDKFGRLKTLSRGADVQVKDESLEDTLMDLANYALMTVMGLHRARDAAEGGVKR